MIGSFVFLYHVSLAQPEGFHFSCSFSRELGDISSVTPPIPRVVLIPMPQRVENTSSRFHTSYIGALREEESVRCPENPGIFADFSV